MIVAFDIDSVIFYEEQYARVLEWTQTKLEFKYKDANTDLSNYTTHHIKPNQEIQELFCTTHKEIRKETSHKIVTDFIKRNIIEAMI